MTTPALYGTDLFGEPVQPPSRGKMADTFILPPFTVLNAREGFWQERKAAWIGLGIRSEIGRGSGVHEYSAAATIHRQGSTLGHDGSKVLAERNAAANHAAPGGGARPACDYKNRERGSGSGSVAPIAGTSANDKNSDGYAKTYNSGAPGALGREYAQLAAGGSEVSRPNAGLPEDQQRALGAYIANGSVIEREAGATGTSIFDPVLCELAYRWFCPAGGLVLDPFAGGSVRGIVASCLGRRYYGIDLRPEQIAANQSQAAAICDGPAPEWATGDSRDFKALAAKHMGDFIFSCPPYGNLEVYSDDPRDISTLEYPQFREAYAEIIKAACWRLKDNRFACFVVGDFRDKRGHYNNFVSDTIAAFKSAGLHYYNEAILVTAVGSLPIRAGKQFNASRKLGKTHQNVLVFVKGDGESAARACGDLKELIA